MGTLTYSKHLVHWENSFFNNSKHGGHLLSEKGLTLCDFIWCDHLWVRVEFVEMPLSYSCFWFLSILHQWSVCGLIVTHWMLCQKSLADLYLLAIIHYAKKICCHPPSKQSGTADLSFPSDRDKWIFCLWHVFECSCGYTGGCSRGREIFQGFSWSSSETCMHHYLKSFTFPA